MCGISGTIFRREYYRGIIVQRDDLEKALSYIIEGNGTVETLLNITWNYKSNYNFLKYYNDKDERLFIDNFCKIIKSLSESWHEELQNIDRYDSPQLSINKYNEYQMLLDCIWFLDVEIRNWYRDISFLHGNTKSFIKDSAVIFYKNLISVINSMDNRLEVRGRDSLGIAIQLYSSYFGLDNVSLNISNSNSESVYFENSNNLQTITFIFKTANQIGSLGDNASKLKYLIKNNQLLKRIILDERADYGTIVAHTRWASVGEISITNCHPIANIDNSDKINFPLYLASLNGDIFNYKELIKSKEIELGILFDPECTTDCLSLPVLFTNEQNVSITAYNNIIKKVKGSFVLALQSSANPYSVLLTRRGIQGLYIGFSVDNVMFASDVYGLVETCRYFTLVESGSLLPISKDTPSYDENLILEMYNIDDSSISYIGASDLRTTPITTRDISKKGYDYYFQKEILETKDIVQRTVLSYLQSPKLIDNKDYHNAILINNSQIPDFIIQDLINGKTKEIIITGMGTCYTAAVAISYYMRNIFKYYYPDIIVEPHIPGEGSTFHLNRSMEDTLVIVVAQSGTTVDTNAYVQHAIDRGASSLAIANKREGDVTFIVNGTLYIGSGRDIEIAVPSTKTYTAQVILGYILTLYFISKINQVIKKDSCILKKAVEAVRKAPDLIDKTFYYLNAKNIYSQVCDYPLRLNSWYITYDYSPNAICAMEIKIKFSECCYHSIPHIHINDLLKYNVMDSFITYITDQELNSIQNILIELLDNNNKLLLIISYNNISTILRKYIHKGDLLIVKIPSSDPFYSFIPTVIAGQLLGYYTALALDKRKHLFLNLLNSIKSGKNIEGTWNIIERAIANGIFNQGFLVTQLDHLKKLYKRFKSNDCEIIELLSYLEYLYQFSKRPIDTIKHQAKTITVGAIREKTNGGYYNYLKSDYIEPSTNDWETKSELNKIFFNINNKDLKLLSQLSSFKEICIYPFDVDLSYGYYIVNFLNEFNHKYKLDYKFYLARHIDYSESNTQKDKLWILLCDSHIDMSGSILNTKEDNCIEINYHGLNIPKAPSLKEYNVYHALSSLYISNLIARKICYLNNITEAWNEYSSKEYRNLNNSWDYIINSKEFKEEIIIAAKIFSSKKNWKCLGSGNNYNISMLCSKRIISKLGSSCSFDVLENHKHIDLSAEAAVLVVIANIEREDYQNDVYYEIEKYVSHNNIPIIFTNLYDRRFDEMKIKIDNELQSDLVMSTPVVRLPRVGEVFSFPLNVLALESFVQELLNRLK